MHIKKAGLNDVPTISRIHAQSWKSAYKGIVPQDYLDNLKEDFWINTFQTWIIGNMITAQMVFQGEECVGCIAYGEARNEKYKEWGEIVSIYLLPEYFGKGFGKILLEKALEDLKNMGHKSIYLWVLAENVQGQNFYKKNGFIKTEDELPGEISGKELTHIRFAYHFA